MRTVMTMRALYAIALLGLGSMVQGRSILQTTHADVHEDHVHFGEIDTHKTRLDYNHTVGLLEIRGVWLGDGDQIAASVYEVHDNDTKLPDCSEHPNEFNYNHFAADDPHYYTISGEENNIIWTQAAHAHTKVLQVRNFTDNLISLTDPDTGKDSCTFFKPYIDLTSGQLKAESLKVKLYTKGAEGPRVEKNLNCEIQGNELPGCYTNEIARGPAHVGTKANTTTNSTKASISAFSIPSGGIVAVSRATFTCQNGECITFTPIYEANHEGGHHHGEEGHEHHHHG